MEILALTGSALLFALFSLVVLFALVNVSSRLALIILFFVPFLGVLVLPGTSMAFLSYRHFLLADGLVPVNNFHILMMVWSTLIGVVLYTEFLTWYLAKGKQNGAGSGSPDIPPAIRNIMENCISFARNRMARKN